MSLHLDARQRAMLQEMGVTVWGPPPATPAPPAAAAVEAGLPAAPQAAPLPAPAPVVAAPRSAPPPPAIAPRTPPASQQAAPATGPGAPALLLHAPRALYPTADPAQTPVGLGKGWLIDLAYNGSLYRTDDTALYYGSVTDPYANERRSQSPKSE